MINISPIGRNCSLDERDAFEQFDHKHHIRKTFVEKLKETFPDYGLTYSIGISFFPQPLRGINSLIILNVGGQISFDVFPTGWDKTYCLRHVAEEGFKEIHFFGDKTFKGGNDYEIYNHPDVKGHAVTSPQDTIKELKVLFPEM